MQKSSLTIGDVCLLKPGMYLSADENKFYSLDKYVECLILNLEYDSSSKKKSYASLLVRDMIIMAWESSIVKIPSRETKIVYFNTRGQVIERRDSQCSKSLKVQSKKTKLKELHAYSMLPIKFEALDP